MKKSIKERIFLVGCARSGTTLLQSILATHTKIISFPESHFFVNLAPMTRWQRLFKLAPQRAKKRFDEFLKDIDYKNTSATLNIIIPFTYQYVRAFVRVLDDLAEQNGKEIWIEKTPMHLHYIKTIEKLIPGSKFIHIVRNGEDVVASLYDVTRKYPEVWGGLRDIDQYIERWIRDIRISQEYKEELNHKIVRYEKLLFDSKSIVTDICQFIGVDFERIMLLNYSNAAERIVLESEVWKNTVRQEIQNTKNRKFNQLFDEPEREYIRDRISAVNVDELLNE